MQKKKIGRMISLSLIAAMVFSGCKTPQDYREEADKVAYDLIHRTEKELFNRESVFSIEGPEDQLRRRLFEAQGLQTSGDISLGLENMSKPKHWPEENYPSAVDKLEDLTAYSQPLKLTLLEALQMAAAHSFDYQNQKETVFASALTLDQQEHYFENIFSGSVGNSLSADLDSTYPTRTTLSNDADLGLSRNFKNGAKLSASIGYAISKMLTLGHDSSHNTTADASITIPLLRGSGEHIATENLTQAQRNLVYAIYEFERYKRTFAVTIASSYYDVLKRINQIENAKANYDSVKTSAERARELAKAGRMTNIQRDQAIQSELSARNSWLSSQESLKTAVDNFKKRLGLPADALLELDTSELETVVAYTEKALNIDLTPARESVAEFNEIRGPFELDENMAVELAFKNRLDLRISQAKVFDSQRAVIISADRLGAELSLFGSANYGSSGELIFDDGNYNAMLNINLPLDRLSERNSYRNSLISLRRSVRSCQSLEDDIKIAIRSKLRDLKDQRNSLQIQAESVRLAEDRVRSTNMFMEAGRVEMRDVLDAETSLLSARNNITSSVISYRLAELELQRDMGLLQIDEKGLWQEFDPKSIAGTEPDNGPVSSNAGSENSSM